MKSLIGFKKKVFLRRHHIIINRDVFESMTKLFIHIIVIIYQTFMCGNTII